MPAGKVFKFTATKSPSAKASRPKAKGKGLTRAQKRDVYKINDKDKQPCTIDSAFQLAQAPIWNMATIHHLTPIPQGTTQHERIGLDVYLKRILGSIIFYRNPALPPPSTPAQLRVTIFRWDEEDVPSWDALYADQNQQRPVKVTFFEKRQGYILADWTMHLTTATNQKTKNFDLTVNKKCQFDGISATDRAEGNIYMAVSQRVADADNQYQFGARAFYKGM